TKTNPIITAFGITVSYHSQCGLNQGSVECPLFWHTLYNALPAEVLNAGLEFSFMYQAALGEHHHLLALVPAVDDADVQEPCPAFVYDTDWITPSRETLQAITDMAREFYAITQIEVNPKKSELVLIYPPDNQAAYDIAIGGDRVVMQPPAVAVRMLRAWASADG
ncbi:hypothetical protein BGZ72_001789, partial [Mortierella alpina]